MRVQFAYICSGSYKAVLPPLTVCSDP